ncbi:MAG TPA: site-2 protease family protein [Anaeromyxobacteraceae bacterium]|nr:site-2 protease family protein [Anaeromyxobacteraceae bacterium]
MPNFDFRRAIMLFVPLILSLAVHEFAHAWTAWRLGDDTAARAGRLTLNPLAHADLIGTIVLPLLGVPFGWAKPVPIDPTRFRKDVSMGTGMAVTAAAGPAANVILAIAVTVVYALLGRFLPDALASENGLHALLVTAIFLNVNLALFNLIPVPPLDGSRIVDGFMPYRLRPQWDRVMALSPFLLVAVFVFAGRIISGPSNFVIGLLDSLARAIAA